MGRYAAEKEKKNPFAIFYSPEYRKFQTVLIGVLLAAATQGLLPAAYSTWVLLIVGVLTAAGVYQVPNGDDAAPYIIEDEYEDYVEPEDEFMEVPEEPEDEAGNKPVG